MDPFNRKAGDLLVIRTFDDWPKNLFEVLVIYENCVTGCSITGHPKHE
ncbi:MAG: hypothetical protein HKN30_08715 [Sulfitobacter sp.]|nr:hypothetical protein [Sulfitobacter sp.]